MINQSEKVGMKRISRSVMIAVISAVIAIAVFASTAFAGLITDYNVKINDDGTVTTVTTDKTEALDILADANIKTGDNDKIDISGFTSGEGGTISVDREKTINVNVDGKIFTYEVYGDTVGEVLKEAGITVGKDDAISFDLTDKATDGMVIDVESAITVSLTVDGKKTDYAVISGTVSDLVNMAGVTLGTDDYTKPALDKELKGGMKVAVYRVTYKEKTATETVKYKTEKTEDSSMYEGESKVTTKGVDGEAEVTYKVKYVNGKEKSKEELSRTVTKKAVTEKKTVGTKVKKSSTSSSSSSVKSNGVTSKGGYSVGQTISGRYTHYCACAVCNGNSRGITSSGKKIQNGMANPYYVACNWLPLGTVISVDGTNYTVVDRGGSGLSAQGRIDIFTPEGHAACYRYGTGGCTIKIVRLGW